jgi:hypothetical protein
MLERDGTEDQTHKASIRRIKAPGQADRPRSRRSTLNRLADENAECGFGFQGLEIIAIADVDIGDWPAPRGIEQLAVCADQRNRVDMRQPRALLLQQLMHVMPGQSMSESLAISHSAPRDVVGNDRKGQIQHLERAVALLGQHDRLALNVRFDGAQCFVA